MLWKFIIMSLSDRSVADPGSEERGGSVLCGIFFQISIFKKNWQKIGGVTPPPPPRSAR